MGKSHTKYMPNLISCPRTQDQSSDLQQISNIFNQNFASVGSNLATKIQEIDCNNYTSKYINESVFMQPVCAVEILFHIDMLDQGFPNFFVPCTPLALREMSMYPCSISTDKDLPLQNFDR